MAARGLMVIGIIFMGALFFDHGISLLPPKYVDSMKDLSRPFYALEYFISIFFGFFFMGFGFAYILYFTQLITKLEAIYLVLISISMPLTEIEGWYVYLWFLLIFLPSLLILLVKERKLLKWSGDESEE